MRYTFLLVSLLVSQVSAAQSAEDILKRMITAINKHESLSYAGICKVKYTGRADTVTADGMVHLRRNDQDSIWGGMVWIGEGTKYDSYSFYDGAHRYVVLNAIHKVMKEAGRKGDMGLSDVYNHLIFQEFLRGAERKYTGATTKATLAETSMAENELCDVVKLQQLGGNSRAINTTLYISRENHLPLRIVEEYTSEPKLQYRELRLHKIQTDKAGPEQFSVKQIPASYKVESRDRQLPKNAEPQIRPRREWPIPGGR